MSELYLKQAEFTHSTCGQFTIHREKNEKFRENGNLKHLYRNELEKVRLTRDAAYSDSKDLAEQTI